MQDNCQDGGIGDHDDHWEEGLFQWVKMEEFDASHTDAASHEIVVDPVFHKEGDHCDHNGQASTDEVTNSHAFEHCFSHFFHQIYHLVEADEDKEYRNYDPRIPDCQKSDVFIVGREPRQGDDGDTSHYAENQKGYPFELKAKWSEVHFDRPDMGVHGYPNDDGCIYEGDDYVADLELFVPTVWVAVEEKTEYFIVFEYEGDFVEVIMRRVWLSAVEFDGKVRFVDEGDEWFWLLIRVDCDLCVVEGKVRDVLVVDE